MLPIVLLLAFVGAVLSQSVATLGFDNCRDCEVALITAGNSGTGKSFTDNLIIGENIFVHSVSAKSVTRETEHVVKVIGGKKMVIYNIPGLVEIEEEKIMENKAEIEEAFKGKSAQVFMFVTTAAVGGRVQGQDVATFLSLQDAFEIKHESVVILVNNVPQDSDASYEADVQLLLRRQLKWPDGVEMKVVFGPDLSTEISQKSVISSPKALALRSRLLEKISSCIPHHYTMKKPIVIQQDVIDKLEAEGKQLRKNLEIIKEKHAQEYQALVEKSRRELEENESRMSRLQNELERAHRETHSTGHRAQKGFEIGIPGVGSISARW